MNKDIVVWVIVVLVAIILVSIPVLWVTATISACGWKGLFVECRIWECGK